ncbi:ArsR/SmtB family transcription factor [Microbacterium arborescens]
MPRLREAMPDMPARADVAWQALSGRVRLELMRTLAAGEPMTIRDIEVSTKFPPPTIRKALAQLEALGYVVVSEPPGQRHGRSVTYALDSDQVRSDYDALGQYFLSRG